MISYMVYVNVTKYEKNRQKIEKFLPLVSDEKEDIGTPLSREQFIEAQKKMEYNQWHKKR